MVCECRLSWPARLRCYIVVCIGEGGVMEREELERAIELAGVSWVAHRVERDGSITILAEGYHKRNFKVFLDLRVWLDELCAGRVPLEIGLGRVRRTARSVNWLRSHPAVVWIDDWDGREWVSFKYLIGDPLVGAEEFDVVFSIPRVNPRPDAAASGPVQ